MSAFSSSSNPMILPLPTILSDTIAISCSLLYWFSSSCCALHSIPASPLPNLMPLRLLSKISSIVHNRPLSPGLPTVSLPLEILSRDLCHCELHPGITVIVTASVSGSMNKGYCYQDSKPMRDNLLFHVISCCLGMATGLNGGGYAVPCPEKYNTAPTLPRTLTG